MKTDWHAKEHDPQDPDPWLAVYLDDSLPMADAAKRAWLTDSRSWSRQFLLPVVRPLARAVIILLQLWKIVAPRRFTSSRFLHRFLYWGLKTWLTPEANLLILRHFNMGSEILDFIARNARGVDVPTRPLKPQNLEPVKDNLFVQHDINLYNFVIALNTQLREKGLSLDPKGPLDFSGLSEEIVIDPLPDRWTNFLDVETAIELFTPAYQLFLTDNDFWRASNSLQLDETMAHYIARLTGLPWILSFVNNKHPLVPLSTLKAGHRLVLHGLSSELLHAVLLKEKHRRAAA